jgi:hypothetical protein
MGFECWERPGEGVHLIESECIAEVIDPATGKEVPEGEAGELVLTNLGRGRQPADPLPHGRPRPAHAGTKVRLRAVVRSS